MIDFTNNPISILIGLTLFGIVAIILGIYVLHLISTSISRDSQKKIEKLALNEARKNILTWIYGTDTKGMTHHFCFPRELLEMILNKTGFENIKTSFFEKEKYNPTQRLICKKTKDYLPFQIISTFRKKLLKNKIVDFNEYYISLEQEKLIDFFLDEIKEYNKKHSIEQFNDIVINGAIKNVKMAKLFLVHD